MTDEFLLTDQAVDRLTRRLTGVADSLGTPTDVDSGAFGAAEAVRAVEDAGNALEEMCRALGREATGTASFAEHLLRGAHALDRFLADLVDGD